MSIKSLSFSSLFYILLISCGNSKSENKEQPPLSIVEEKKTVEKRPPVTLNKGQKWKVSLDIVQSINKMLQLTEIYQAEPDDLDRLKNKLEREFAIILAKSDVSTEDYIQLQSYLITLKDKIDDVNGNNIEEFDDYLKQFHDYFE